MRRFNISTVGSIAFATVAAAHKARASSLIGS